MGRFKPWHDLQVFRCTDLYSNKLMYAKHIGCNATSRGVFLNN